MINTLIETVPIVKETEEEAGQMVRRFQVWTRDVVRDASVGAWQAVTFENSWVDVGGAFNSAEFRALGDKRVEIRGLISSGTIGLAAFTLPVGFRPVADYSVPCVSSGAFAQTNVGSDGTVVPTVGVAVSFALDGIVISLD